MRTLFGAALIFSALATGTALAAQHGISKKQRAFLVKEARAFAKRHGDPHPYDVQAVRTTVAGAERRIHPDQRTPVCESNPTCDNWPVYVIAMRGHFEACGVVQCAILPVAWFEIVAKRPAPEFAGGSGAMGPNYPDLRAAGVPIRLNLSSRTRG